MPRLQNVAKDYMDKVARSHGDLKGYLDQASTQIIVGVDEATHKLADRLSTTNTQFLTGLDQTANQLFAQLNAAGSGLAGKVEETTNRLFNEIGQKSTQINLKLDETSTGVFDRLDQQANYVNSHIEETASKLYNNLDSRANALGTTIEDNALCACLMPSTAKHATSTAGSAIVVQLQSTGSTINDLLVTTSGTIVVPSQGNSDVLSPARCRTRALRWPRILRAPAAPPPTKMIAVSGEFISEYWFRRTKHDLPSPADVKPAITRKWMRRPQLFGRLMTRPCRSPARSPPLPKSHQETRYLIGSTIVCWKHRTGSVRSLTKHPGLTLFAANTKMMSDQLDQTDRRDQHLRRHASA
jgi:hypothetical protein